MNKQCAKCKYATAKPTLHCACNNKVKLGDNMVQFKYSGEGLPYCDGFKPGRSK